MTKTRKNYRFSNVTREQLGTIQKLLPAENETAAVERAIHHFHDWLVARQPLACQVCGEQMTMYDRPPVYIQQCDCESDL